MKILMILENYAPHIGGVEVVFKELAEGLVKKGYEVNVLTRKLPKTEKYEIMNGVKIHRISCLNRYFFSFLAICKAVKMAKESDIIHTTTYNGALPARIASIISKKPCLITVHEVLGKNWGMVMNPVSALIHRFLEYIIMKLKFNMFVSVSKSTEKGVLKYTSKNKSEVVYDGVDYEFWNPKKYDKGKVRNMLGLKGFTYMFYGRPGITKGLEYLIKAVPIISRQIPNAKLIAIVSKDRQYMKRYNYILKLIDELNVKDKVILLEPVKRNELPEHIMASDCVVVPSLTEGFGFTAAESCALGKPVVASNTTSLPEVVSGKYVLVKPASPEDIAKGVIDVYRGKIKSKKKKLFKLNDNINGYIQIYRNLK